MSRNRVVRAKGKNIHLNKKRSIREYEQLCMGYYTRDRYDELVQFIKKKIMVNLMFPKVRKATTSMRRDKVIDVAAGGNHRSLISKIF